MCLSVQLSLLQAATKLLWQPPEEYICEIVEMLCVWNVLYCILLEIKLLLLIGVNALQVTIFHVPDSFWVRS